MEEKRVGMRVNLKVSHVTALDELALKEIKTPSRLLDEALDFYLKSKLIQTGETARPTASVQAKAPATSAPAAAPAMATVPAAPAVAAVLPGPSDDLSDKPRVKSFEEQLAGLATRARDTNSILLRIPTIQKLWDFSDKASIRIGKRTVSEVYDFKKFLDLGEEQVQEFKLLKIWLSELKDDGRVVRSLEHKKEHATVTVSTDELTRGYESSRDSHYTLVPGADGTYSLLKTAMLKTLLHKENVQNKTSYLVPCGDTVILVPNPEEAGKVLLSYDALTNKLDRIADRIITEYRPIDQKWTQLQEDRMAGVRLAHGVLQFLTGAILFAAITWIYVTNPTMIMPLLFTDQPNAGFRNFFSAYILMFPVSIIFFNYLIVYMIWYKSASGNVMDRTRKEVEKDIRQLRRSLESEL